MDYRISSSARMHAKDLMAQALLLHGQLRPGICSFDTMLQAMQTVSRLRTMIEEVHKEMLHAAREAAS